MDDVTKAKIMARLTRDTMNQISWRSDKEAVYQNQNRPLPLSSQELLSSLQKTYKKRHFSTPKNQVPSPVEGAVTLADKFDKAKIPYAIGGALAFGYWGTPRGTADVDVNVFLELNQLVQLLDIIEEVGYTFNRQEIIKTAEERGQFTVSFKRGQDLLKLCIFLPSIEFSWEAMKTRVKKPMADSDVWVLSAEATIIFKMMFYRSKDLTDIESILEISGPKLDLGYIRQHIDEMLTSDRLEWWDNAVKRLKKIK